MDKDSTASRNLQVWRLSDLALLHTVPLPDGPAGDEGLLTAEPRVLADGRTVLGLDLPLRAVPDGRTRG